eukprot:gene7895-1106_t
MAPRSKPTWLDSHGTERRVGRFMHATYQPVNASRLAACRPCSSKEQSEQEAAPTTAPTSSPIDVSKVKGYYQGMVTSNIAETNGATAGDMLKRSLQLDAGLTHQDIKESIQKLLTE